MDFLRRGSQTNQHVAAAPTGATQHQPTHHTPRKRDSKWFRLATVLLLFSGTILVVALLVTLIFGGPKNEGKYIDDTKLQAVFLNGGQVYFGDITALNSQYLRLQNIYYLRVNQQVQPEQESSSAGADSNDVSLVKLGCELHGPHDSMVINREQIIFWENLKTDGQVAKAVAAYVQQNPNGQQCNQAGTQTTPSTDSNQ